MPGEQIHDPLHSTNGNGNGHLTMDRIMESSRLVELEEKTKQQDLEIHLLKCTLADTLNRINALEKNAGKKASTNGRRKSAPVSPIAETKPTNVSKRHSVPARRPTSSLRHSQTPPEQQKTNKKHAEMPQNGSQAAESNGKSKIILSKRTSFKKKKSPSTSEDSPKSPTKDGSIKFYIRGRSQSLYPPTFYEESKGEAPNHSLELQWIHGYRGKDCRNNLHCVATGEIVYNMAGVVILYHPHKHTQRHFHAHTDAVKCVTVHPDKTHVASGQLTGHGDEGKAHVLVWNSETLQVTSSFGHGRFERGLAALMFSSLGGGKYLVCMDDSNDHITSIWDWRTSQYLHAISGTKDVIFAMVDNPHVEGVFSTYGKQHLYLWSIDENLVLTKRMAIFGYQSKPKFVLCVAHKSDGALLSGDSNGNIQEFKEGNKITHSVLEAHKGGVFCMYWTQHDVLITCGKDGQLSLWNHNLEKLKDLAVVSDKFGPGRCFVEVENEMFLGTTYNCILKYTQEFSKSQLVTQGHSDEMWGLACHGDGKLFATCSHDRVVCLWDGSNKQNIWSTRVEDHAQCLAFHSSQDYLIVGLKSGRVVILNTVTSEEMTSFGVARDFIDAIKVSPDEKLLAVTSRDANLYVLKWNDDLSFDKPKIFKGHSSRVLHVDWSVDSHFLQSSSSDYEILFWHAESGSQVVSSAALRDTEWSTWTNPFGFPVMGIWPEGADGTDINACCRSNDHQHVATGDDFGQVNLFKYPCSKLKSESVVGRGHCSHVTCVRFLGNQLLSVGGKDCSVMQWSLVPKT